MVRMDIQTIMVGMGPISSLVVLRPRDAQEHEDALQLPIRIGSIEASALSMGVDGSPHERPMTHDLLLDCISSMGGTLESVEIADVQGTTFFAKLCIQTEMGRRIELDARPSDALALAVRAHAPVFADEKVLRTAAMPDFGAVEHDEKAQELERFHDFVEHLSPEDFE